MSPKLADCRDRFSIFGAVVAAPIDRFSELGQTGRVLSIVVSLVGSLYNQEMLAGVLTIVVISSIVDHYMGKIAAKRAGVFDPLLARIGLLTKASAIVMVLLVRAFEWWGHQHSIPGLGSTHGFLSCALAVGLFVMDLESIEHHRLMLKAKPIPGFSRLLALLRTVEQRLFPQTPEPTPVPEAQYDEGKA